MAWIKVESSVARNRKFLAAGPAASWLWLCGLTYCQEGLTDGFIPTEALPVLGVIGRGKNDPSRLSALLVLAHLWDVVDGGWRVHDYLKHQKSAEELREVQQWRREAGERGGIASGEARRKQVALDTSKQNIKTVEATTKQPSNPDQNRSEQIRTDQEEQKISAEPSNGSSPSVMTFPTVGPSSTWSLTSAQLVDWQILFPNLDALAEMRKALAWLQANAANRKTAKGMPRCLVAWLTRAVDNGGPMSSTRAPAVHRQAEQEPAYEPWTCPHVEDHASKWRCEQATALNRPRKADAS